MAQLPDQPCAIGTAEWTALDPDTGDEYEADGDVLDATCTPVRIELRLESRGVQYLAILHRGDGNTWSGTHRRRNELGEWVGGDRCMLKGSPLAPNRALAGMWTEDGLTYRWRLVLPDPTQAKGVTIGSLADVAPTVVLLGDAWNGYGVPYSNFHQLERGLRGAFAGTSTLWNAHEEKETKHAVRVSGTVMGRALRLIAAARVTEEPHAPSIVMTDHYPDVTWVLAGTRSILTLRSTSQADDHAPWTVQFGPDALYAGGPEIGAALIALRRALDKYAPSRSRPTRAGRR